MPKDRSWILLDHRLKAYHNGVVEFLDFAFSKSAIDNKIRCPCRDCKCGKIGDRNFVHKHLLWRGWDLSYGQGRWRNHQESEEEYRGGEMNDGNHAANRRWADFKTKKLKNDWFDKAPNLEAAKANRPEGLISATMWEELCDQFASISEPGANGKSKSEKCRDSRKAVSTDHHWGRTSIRSWSHKIEQKFGKSPSVVDTYKKAYMGIDALIEPVESSTDEGDTQEPPIGRGTHEQLAISVELEKAYEESIRDGSDESTANTIACQKMLGKTKILGIQGSSTKRARSILSSTREEEMKEEIESLKQQLQEQKEETAKQKEESATQINQLQQNFETLLDQLRQQGILNGSSSQVPPSQ